VALQVGVRRVKKKKKKKTLRLLVKKGYLTGRGKQRFHHTDPVWPEEEVAGSVMRLR
jgi:hypothetical protein